jgi:hypothetical protein
MGRQRRSDRPKVQGEKWTSVSCFLTFASLFPFTCSLFFLTGCNGLNQAVANDPLLGGPPLRPTAAAAPAPPTPVAALPPPAANSTLSNAALAAGAPRPPDSGRDLRISSPRPSSGNDGWAREGNPASGRGQVAESSGALLRPPEPVTEPFPRRELATVSNPGSPRDTQVFTYEQAQDQIKARGVLWQRLEMVAESGEWRYSCSIPNRQNPRIRRTYEAKASDSVTAIRAVLEQLDKEQ